jgi:signal transduction histidine kinase
MAMQKSEDLAQAVAIVFDELNKLDLGMLRCGIGILNKGKHSVDVWTTTLSDNDSVVQVSGNESMDIHPLLQGAYEAWVEQHDYEYVLKGTDLNDYYKALKTENFKLPASQSLESGTVGLEQYYFNAIFSSGGLFAFRDSPFPEEAKAVMKRFADVFNLTYTRFNDLKQAEAQAREATIEAALERVRGNAMAMHSSVDLSATVNVFFKELRGLGIVPIRCGVGEVDEVARTSTLAATTASTLGDSYEIIGKLKLAGHPVLDKIFDHWKSQEEYYPELKGKDLTEYYRAIRPQVHFPDYTDEKAQYGSYFYFPEGLVFAWTEKALSEEEIRIFRRFTSVISLTYRRYIELQRSEANAKDALKQASLDRIRAEIASMRTTSDLERITPLIWKELNILGIPFIRCGVFIMDDSLEQIHTFLSNPEGKAIAAVHIPYTTQGNIQHVINHWRDKSVYADHWDKAAFTEFARLLMQQSGLASMDQYLDTLPQEGFCLHFLPFLQGMLYVGNTSQLGEHDMKLLQSVADAFSTAYARYEDFNKLEAAKQQVDKTLADLKQTQQQLVQSEKMASLGELTAGIAHEIQNPLNFVNNFSEVSNELLDEMMQEVARGNYDEVKAIVEDVKQNLEKINHHGKRADGIVKGMLQHSRSSSATKESTDINKLADEYLRLAYHGLRAKDKTFNASMKTEYDEAAGNILVIPQDIGRVILNLITNAFYAVNEKKKLVHASNGAGAYEPTITVSTKRTGNTVSVAVRDNGNGIPQKVVDKIFQPFFTTKPTGQGTGLGLSLSYDIVKAHGGELKVETKENEGSEFFIHLPVSSK